MARDQDVHCIIVIIKFVEVTSQVLLRLMFSLVNASDSLQMLTDLKTFYTILCPF